MLQNQRKAMNHCHSLRELSQHLSQMNVKLATLTRQEVNPLVDLVRDNTKHRANSHYEDIKYQESRRYSDKFRDFYQQVVQKCRVRAKNRACPNREQLVQSTVTREEYLQRVVTFVMDDTFVRDFDESI